MDHALLPRQSGGGLDTFQFYYYSPSLAAATIFIVVFALTTGMHVFQMLKTRTWFLIPFFIGGCRKNLYPLPLHPNRLPQRARWRQVKKMTDQSYQSNSLATSAAPSPRTRTRALTPSGRTSSNRRSSSSRPRSSPRRFTWNWAGSFS